MLYLNVISIHIVTAIFSIILGGLVLFSKKGTKYHKLMGRFWVICMVTVCVTSFWLTGINGDSYSPIHLLSIWTLFCLFQGVRHILKKNVKTHRAYMKGSYIGLVIAGLATLSSGRLINLWLMDKIKFFVEAFSQGVLIG